MLAAAPAGAQDCKLVRYATMDLVGRETGVPIIAGSVNGKPARFIVDTGNVWSDLPKTLAEGLPRVAIPPSIRFLDAAEEKITSAVTVNELGFGPLKLSKLEFLQTETAALGANLLDIFDIEIDPVDRKLNVFRHKECDGAPSYWPHDDLVVVPFHADDFGRILLDVMLDGKSYEALMDTGAEISELDDRTARKDFDIELGSAGTEASNNARSLTGKTIEEYRHQFGTLEIENLRIDHPWLRLGVHGHSFFNPGRGPYLVLGMSTWAPFHIYIAYKEHKLYLTTARGDVAAGRKPSESGSGSDPLARLNLQELMESAQNAIKAGDTASAHAAFNRAVELAPDDPAPLLARAQFLSNQHDEAGAKADLDRLNSMPLQSAAQYMGRSAGYRLTGQFDRALADANAAVRRAPNLPAAWNERCWTEAVIGHLEPALADCNAALAIEPKSADALDSRGLVHLKSGRLDAAIADYSAAIAVKPKNASSLYGRSLAERRKGNIAAADADLAAARAIAPDIESSFGT